MEKTRSKIVNFHFASVIIKKSGYKNGRIFFVVLLCPLKIEKFQARISESFPLCVFPEEGTKYRIPIESGNAIPDYFSYLIDQSGNPAITHKAEVQVIFHARNPF